MVRLRKLHHYKMIKWDFFALSFKMAPLDIKFGLFCTRGKSLMQKKQIGAI